MAKFDYSNLMQDTLSNHHLELIKSQVQSEIVAWTDDYHASGKKGAELSESDVQTIIARRWARRVCASSS
jgi:hypothetical protein